MLPPFDESPLRKEKMVFNLISLPITYNSWDEGEGHGSLIFNGVTFKKAFGVIKAGSRFDNIMVDFLDGTITTSIGVIQWIALPAC